MQTFTTFGISETSWNIVQHLFAPRATGRPRLHCPRIIWNAIQYVVKTGCQWHLLPGSFPPWKTVYFYFRKWSLNGILEQVNDLLRQQVRKLAGKDKPPIVIIDSQSVKSTSLAQSKGFDGHKKIKGKKRHLMVDSLGFIIFVLLLRANIHDIKGGRCLLARCKGNNYFKCLKQAHMDSAYKGIKLPRGVKAVISSVAKLKKFVPIPHRWKVERTIAWLEGYRRLAKDYEKKNFYGENMVYVASAMMADNRLKLLR